jgi:hypothetical protein
MQGGPRCQRAAPARRVSCERARPLALPAGEAAPAGGEPARRREPFAVGCRPRTPAWVALSPVPQARGPCHAEGGQRARLRHGQSHPLRPAANPWPGWRASVGCAAAAAASACYILHLRRHARLGRAQPPEMSTRARPALKPVRETGRPPTAGTVRPSRLGSKGSALGAGESRGARVRPALGRGRGGVSAPPEPGSTRPASLGRGEWHDASGAQRLRSGAQRLALAPPQRRPARQRPTSPCGQHSTPR